MKSTVIALTLAALSVFWGPTTSTFGGDSKVAKGTITAIGGQSLTVKVGDRDMAFDVDRATTVTAHGASTKAARLAASGKAGPHLSDLLKPGQAVSVTYRDMAGIYHASDVTAIRYVPNPAATADARSTGVITAMGPDWITINGRIGGGGSFEQTFKIDPHTMVWVKGASKAVAAKGGRAPFSDLVGSGDHVNVSYHKAADGLLASDLWVTMKATH
jgi:hypothetical protein